jgi:hypothetical protein
MDWLCCLKRAVLTLACCYMDGNGGCSLLVAAPPSLLLVTVLAAGFCRYAALRPLESCGVATVAVIAEVRRSALVFLCWLLCP